LTYSGSENSSWPRKRATPSNPAKEIDTPRNFHEAESTETEAEVRRRKKKKKRELKEARTGSDLLIETNSE